MLVSDCPRALICLQHTNEIKILINRICRNSNSVVFVRHLFEDFFCLKSIHSKEKRNFGRFFLWQIILHLNRFNQISTMDGLNFRIAEEKNFHSEVLLFSFNPEHDIIVVCSANGDVCVLNSSIE